MLPASDVSAPFGMRTIGTGMCSNESGIERRSIFILASRRGNAIDCDSLVHEMRRAKSLADQFRLVHDIDWRSPHGRFLRRRIKDCNLTIVRTDLQGR